MSTQNIRLLPDILQYLPESLSRLPIQNYCANLRPGIEIMLLAGKNKPTVPDLRCLARVQKPVFAQDGSFFFGGCFHTPYRESRIDKPFGPYRAAARAAAAICTRRSRPTSFPFPEYLRLALPAHPGNPFLPRLQRCVRKLLLNWPVVQRFLQLRPVNSPAERTRQSSPLIKPYSQRRHLQSLVRLHTGEPDEARGVRFSISGSRRIPGRIPRIPSHSPN